MQTDADIKVQHISRVFAWLLVRKSRFGMLRGLGVEQPRRQPDVPRFLFWFQGDTISLTHKCETDVLREMFSVFQTAMIISFFVHIRKLY